MTNSALKGLRRALMAGAPLILAACANLNTIERRTTLPGDDESGDAIAVHLDAKQRVLVSHASGIYCAEPKPDALAANSSGQGASASVAGKGSGAISLSATESAGSIGLRTQSIELQREIFYRLCEAYYNGALTEVQLATLFGRSQNLTAVVLAVEQLTGAVAANQVILAGSSGSSSLASLVSDQKALEAARENETRAKDRLDAAAKAKTDQDALLAEATAAAEGAEAALAAEKAKDEPDAAAVARLQADVDAKEKARRDAATKAEELGRAEAQAKLNHEDAIDVRQKIEASLDSATSSAASNATSSGQFSVIAPRRELSAEATKEIAESVEAMVLKALETDDTIPTCLGVLAWVAQEEQVYREAQEQIDQLSRRQAPQRRNLFGVAQPSGNEQSAAALQKVVDDLSAGPRARQRDTARAVCLEIITKHVSDEGDS